MLAKVSNLKREVDESLLRELVILKRDRMLI